MQRRWIAFWVIALLALALGFAGQRGGSAGAAPRTPREQRMPALAFNSHKDVQDFLLVWVEDRGSGPNIYGKRLFNNGLPQGGPDKIGAQVIRADDRRSDPDGPRADPSLVYNPQQEEYLLVFSEDTGTVTGWDVFATRVNPAGFAVSPPRLIAGGEGDQQHPDVELIPEASSDEDRDYLVVFDDNTRDVDEVRAVRLRSNGIPKARPYVLVTSTTSNASDPTTTGDAVAWVDDRGGQTDIWSLRLKSGKPEGKPYRLSGDMFEDDFAPRYGGTGLVWNVYDPGSGADIRGAQIYANNTTRGNSVGILVPSADQSWPDGGVGTDGDKSKSVVVFSDNRSGEYDLYAVRTTNFRLQGQEFPLVVDSIAP